jgi:cellulose synthase/poly-beta-1,6-N-acetylglucosamine synthase-like glycosyltransferase
VALPVLLPLALLGIEFAAALLPKASGRQPGAGPRPRVAVLVPAHNEAAVIGHTLDSLFSQLLPGDRLIVVADNCNDDTTAIAEARGATVIRRDDAERFGKGYALDWGMRYLQRDPPQVVVVVDADTPAQAGALEALARLAQGSSRPVQAVYMLQLPSEPEQRHRLSAFAWLVKNCVRPAGLARLGLPCLLTGSGMAFPWEVVRQAPLARGAPAVDMRLTADLAVRGHVPLFCAEARIGGVLTKGLAAAQTQRRRWEHGHLQTLLSQTPRLMVSAIRQRRLDMAALALEMAVPPLSLLFMLWAGDLVLTTLAGLAGASWVPAGLLAAAAALCSLAALAVWARFGRAILPLRAVLALPGYVWAKVPLYVAFVTHRQRTWERTDRETEHVERRPSKQDQPPASGRAG